MGLLDEAIREHLELKRRHGADAAEIARLEQEALGPARRTPADVAPEASDSAPLADRPVAAAEPEGAAATPALPESEAPSPEAPTTVHAPLANDDEYEYGFEDEPLPIATPEQQTVEFEPESEEDWADDWDESGDEPEPYVPPAAPAPEPRRAQDAPGDKTGEGEGDAKGEDVLEETPEFLQETPEHDRLWFEQKPPRDFEF
jgi:hypothetical protein